MSAPITPLRRSGVVHRSIALTNVDGVVTRVADESFNQAIADVGAVGGQSASQDVVVGRPSDAFDVTQRVGAAKTIARRAGGQIDVDRTWRAVIGNVVEAAAAVDAVVAGQTFEAFALRAVAAEQRVVVRRATNLAEIDQGVVAGAPLAVPAARSTETAPPAFW
ncbi:MAG: hypothetical protein IPL11_18315 [Candidatus Accumulibacter sp.]|nr:hypothetical protein [Accumulibacter sp.]